MPKSVSKVVGNEIVRKEKEIVNQEIERIVVFYRNGSFKNYMP
jgi:hypothetical protein